jgi:hypothetical protein
LKKWVQEGSSLNKWSVIVGLLGLAASTVATILFVVTIFVFLAAAEKLIGGHALELENFAKLPSIC